MRRGNWNNREQGTGGFGMAGTSSVMLGTMAVFLRLLYRKSYRIGLLSKLRIFTLMR